MKAKKEHKYLVINVEKLEEYFSQFTKGTFTTDKEKKYIDSLTWKEVIDAVDNDNKYIVCNQDEPYAEEVWQTILKGEDAKGNEVNKTIFNWNDKILPVKDLEDADLFYLERIVADEVRRRHKGLSSGKK